LPKQLDRGRQRTFLDESRAWENLHQRNIVQLIQTVVSPPLLELEYVEGGSLKEFLARNPVVDKKRACYIINDIARGLQYAHSKDVVHGDLKPSNILLTKTLEAKITDWSVGKAIHRVTPLRNKSTGVLRTLEPTFISLQLYSTKWLAAKILLDRDPYWKYKKNTKQLT